MHGPLKQGSVWILVLILLSTHAINLTSAKQAKSTTVWNDTITIPDGFTVSSNEVLVIQPGTIVKIGSEERIWVNGRINVLGTHDSPVLFESSGVGDHEGLQFNSSSLGMNSVIENLTITDATYGITIFHSDPTVNNLTVINADKVALDLFSQSSPEIRDLSIQGGGQDIHGSTTSWRYGIGLSIGDESAPIVRNVTIDGTMTRGLNIWGNSGGLIFDATISNISGATLAASAGIWVEDSVPLISDSLVLRSDNGIIVRHQSPGITTRPTFEGAVVEDSQYRGVLVEQYNHSNYANLETIAIFKEIEVRGTGGPGAKTPNLGFVAFDVNTTGVKIIDGLIEDNPVIGLRAFVIDSSTNLSGLKLRNNGDPSSDAPSHEGAGLLFRSTSWTQVGPPKVYDLVVENSSGTGVHMSLGGVIGGNWTIENNNGTGVYLNKFHPRIENLAINNNSDNGLSVIESSNVELSWVSTSGNGIGGTVPEHSAGFYFYKSNYVMSDGKNVTCLECSSIADQHGFVIRDSIDLQLISTTIQDSVTLPALDINNHGTNHAGTILIEDMAVNSEEGQYSVFLDGADADISGLDLGGETGGMYWEARGSATTFLSNSVLWESEAHCLDLVGHTEMISSNVTLMCTDNAPTINTSMINFTDSTLNRGPSANNSFMMLGNSHLRWISSSDLATPSNGNLHDSIVDVMWSIDIHAINQNLLNIPFAEINATFTLFEDDLNHTLPYSGFKVMGPFVGKRWTPLSNWSSVNSASIECSFDGINNVSAPLPIDNDQRVYCRLELSNQPPYIVWDNPVDGAELPSGSELFFDASGSWDLDFDNLSFNWSSSIDGDILDMCGSSIAVNNSSFIVNTIDNPDCLSDGIHSITLEVCDLVYNLQQQIVESKCVNETRQIELVNLPPVLSVGTTPDISSWGTLYLGETASVTVFLDGTYDPEDGPLWCWVTASYESEPDLDPNSPNCPMEISRSFIGATQDPFSVSVIASDGVNPPVSWTFDVDLFNEIPIATMEVQRNGNTSSDWVYLTGTSVFDPEGDDIKFEFWSDKDGLLGQGVSPADQLEWVGTLSKGTHTVSLKVSDNRPEHAASWNSIEQEIIAENSIPNAIISYPINGHQTDSSILTTFDASGSGDWDISCQDMPDNGSNLLCNSLISSSDDIVSVLWQSNLSDDPLGSNWSISTRLSSGHHLVTLTVDDGSVQKTSSISVLVNESAPFLLLDSPSPNIESKSNVPVSFDFRDSIDYDGDPFTVSLYSNLTGIIFENADKDTVYDEFLMHGEHELRFVLTDSTGKSREHSQKITITQTGPIAVITGLENGQYIPPGFNIEISGAESYDFDNDIVLYEWSLSTGEVIGDRVDIEPDFPPGPIRIDLVVTDSRGESSFASINLTIGSSAPELRDLDISISQIENGVATDVLATVILIDQDGTTQIVRGELTYGGKSESLYFRDDGSGGDQIAGDGIWTHRSNWLVSEGPWAKVEVWAVDSDLVSSGLVQSLPVTDGGRGLPSWLTSTMLPLVGISTLALGIAGIAYQRRRVEEIARDMELIEEWSSFEPRELDPEFDTDDS